MDTEQLKSVVYAQGWLSKQIEHQAEVMKSEAHDKMLEVWKTIDAALDQLVRENQQLERQLSSIAGLVGDRFVITQK